MKPILIILTVVLLIVVFLFQCCINTKLEKEAVVRKKCKDYLKNKYSKEFEILQFKQFFHGGIWKYETDLEAAPTDNELLKFWIRYDAKNRIVARDDYKKVFWEYQIEQELRPIISDKYKLLEFDSRLSKNGSIIFVNSNLEFYPDYHEMISNIELPVLHLSIRIAGMPKAGEQGLDCFVKLSEVLAKTAFVKSEFSVYFYDKAILNNDKNNFTTNSNQLNESFCKQQLFFKITNRLKAPQLEDLNLLLVNYASDSLFKTNKQLFEKAEKARKEGKPEEALEVYLKIVSSVSDYRYTTNAPAEAAYSIESAFYAGEILEQHEKQEQAMDLYKGIVRRMEYEEVKLNLSDFYKKAKQKLEEEKK